MHFAIYRFRTQENNTMRTWLKTDDTASYMEPDLFIKGNLLFSMNQALLTSDGTTQQLIVGQSVLNMFNKIPYVEGVGKNATFSKITSFAQLNTSYVLLADSKHGCIRGVDRYTNKTKLVAGICKEQIYYSDTHIDGDLTHATFHVVSTIAYRPHEIYVVEQMKKTVRKVDLKENKVTTVVNEKNLRKYDVPRRFVIDNQRNMIFLTAFNGLLQINLVNDSVAYLTKEKGKRGSELLSNSKWSGASEIIFLDDDTLLVTDTFNGRLRVIDLKSMTVNTWCFSYPKSKGLCEYHRSPGAMTVMVCDVYLSIVETIQKLKLPTWFCGKEKGKIPTTTTTTKAPTIPKIQRVELKQKTTPLPNSWYVWPCFIATYTLLLFLCNSSTPRSICTFSSKEFFHILSSNSASWLHSKLFRFGDHKSIEFSHTNKQIL